MIRITAQSAEHVAELLQRRSAPSGDTPSAKSEPEVTAAPSAAQKVSRSPHLVALGGRNPGEIFPLVGRYVMIGRSESCALRFRADPLMSALNTLLYQDKGHWYCSDRQSRNGTYVNGFRVQCPSQLVVSGSILSCGQQDFRIVYPDASVVTADTATEESPTEREPNHANPFPHPAEETVPMTPEIGEEPEEPMQHLKELITSVFGQTPADPEKQRGSRDLRWRWVPPGTPVTVQGITLPDGMVYVGSSLAAMWGVDNEAALIVTEAPIDTKKMTERVERTWGYYSYASYANLDPAARARYLNWLATGRSEPAFEPSLLRLFFYGLERRLLHRLVGSGSHSAEIGPDPAEEAALCGELRRLIQCYPDYEVAHKAEELLEFLQMRDLLASGDTVTLPDVRRITTKSQYRFGQPQVLRFALARIAESGQALPAEWAWAWFLHDHESRIRTAATRCSEEMHRLFVARYSERVGKKGIRLRPVSQRVLVDYSLLNPSCYNSANLTGRNRMSSATTLFEVNRAPLRRLRGLADSCTDELAAYSRRLGRDPDSRDTLPALALLPDPLFTEHPAAADFRAYLDSVAPKETGRGAPLAIAPLLTLWRRPADPAAAKTPNSDPLSRQDTLALLDAVDRLDFVIEPDLRLGGAPLTAGADGKAEALIARRGDGPRELSPAIYRVALPLLARAARAAGKGVDPAALAKSVRRLPTAAASDPSRIAARLHWLAEHPVEGAKLPRRADVAALKLTPADISPIADLLIATVGQAGAVGPTVVAELIRLFAVLDLPDGEVYERLHSSASARARQPVPTAAPSARRRAAAADSDEPLVTVRRGRRGSEFALPEPAPAPPPKRRGVDIDHALVQQKVKESEHVGMLLANIFTDAPADATKTAAPATPPAPEKPTTPGALSARETEVLRALLEKKSWSKTEVAALARKANLLPNAAIEAINEAAFERFEEPILEGEDPIYINAELARELLQ